MQAYPYRIYSVFPNYGHRSAIGAREIHENLTYVLELRNRIMHHEPIFGGVAVPNKPSRPIDQVHSEILKAIGWIDTDFAKTAKPVDRFDHVFKNGKTEILANLANRLATL